MTFPLSMPGVVSGTLLTFIPASGDYVNSELLGSTDTKMVGNVIQSQFLRVLDYPTAAALSFILMAIVLVMVTVYIRRAGTRTSSDALDPQEPRRRRGPADARVHDPAEPRRDGVLVQQAERALQLLLAAVLPGRLEGPCGVADMCQSLSLSLQLAAWATLGAVALGTAIAFALVRYRFRARGATNSLIFLPMAMPEVVMAASLLTLFLNMGIELGFWTVLIAHITFCLSFVVTAVKARVMSMDPRLEEAARDLYAGPAQTFLRVTLPIAAPGIAAGALLAFALSFDDFIITNFNAGPSTVTFPMFVWGSAQRGTPVQINVIGTAMFVLAVLVVMAGQIITNRRKKTATA